MSCICLHACLQGVSVLATPTVQIWMLYLRVTGFAGCARRTGIGSLLERQWSILQQVCQPSHLLLCVSAVEELHSMSRLSPATEQSVNQAAWHNCCWLSSLHVACESSQLLECSTCMHSAVHLKAACRLRVCCLVPAARRPQRSTRSNLVASDFTLPRRRRRASSPGARSELSRTRRVRRRLVRSGDGLQPQRSGSGSQHLGGDADSILNALERSISARDHAGLSTTTEHR